MASTGATIHRAFHPGRAFGSFSDSYIRLAHRGQKVQERHVTDGCINKRCIILFRGVVDKALAAAEHVAEVTVVLEFVVACAILEFVYHSHLVRTDSAATHVDDSLAGIRCQGDVRNRASVKRPSEVTHTGNFAAAVHPAQNLGTGFDISLFNGVVDAHFRVLHQRHKQGRSLRVVRDTHLVALAATKHLTHRVVAESHNVGNLSIGRVDNFRVVTHLTAIHPDEDIAVFLAFFSTVGDDVAVLVHTREGQTAATENGAVDLSATHEHGNVAAHTAGIVVGLAVVMATTEDVAVVARSTHGTHEAADIFGVGIAQHVTVFSAAEDAAPDAVVLVVVWIPFVHFHLHMGVVHVGDVVIFSAIRA